MNRPRIIKWIKIAFLVYIVLGAAVYFLQDYILFHPEILRKNQAYNFSVKPPVV